MQRAGSWCEPAGLRCVSVIPEFPRRNPFWAVWTDGRPRYGTSLIIQKEAEGGVFRQKRVVPWIKIRPGYRGCSVSGAFGIAKEVHYGQ